MASKVFTGGDGMVSQIALGRVIQPTDPVQILPNMAPTVLPHLNNSLQIINPAGSITERGTQVANRYSALNGMPVKHPPPVAKGQTVPFRDKENGFLSWAKNVFKEGGQMVMNGVSTGVNAIVTVLAPEAKQFMTNAEQVVTGLTMNDFKEAGQDLGEDVMAALQDPQTYIGLATTLAAVAAQGIPVVGQVVGGALAVQRVAGVAEASVQAAQELAELAKMWTQPMSPAQLSDARQRLAKFLTGAGLSILMAVAGKAIHLRPRARSKQNENSNKPVETNKTGPPPRTSCACASRRPVIIATGEKLLEETDFELPGLIPMAWRRRYRSGDVEQGWFGQGWSSPYGVSLRLSAQGLLYKDEQGRPIELPTVSVGEQYFEPYETFTLHHPQPDEWMLEFKGGTQYWFTRHQPAQWRLPLGVIADRNGNAVHLHWSTSADAGADPFAEPELHRIEDSAGRVVELDWLRVATPERPSGLTRLVEVRLTQGPREAPAIEALALARYEYSAEGDLIASERCGFPYRQYAWREHVLVAYRKATGHRYGVVYDIESPAGRVLRSWSVDDTPGTENTGGELADHFSYEPFRTTHTDALGRRTLYETDARGDIVATCDAAGQVSRTPFDTNGHPKGSTDALGRSTGTHFDRRGNLTRLIDAAGNATTIKYNALDLPALLTDAMGGQWRREYDARGNLLASTDPLDQTTRYEVDARGQPVAIIDALGRRKTLQWDGAGNLVSYTDCSGQVSRMGYDVLGRLTHSVDALGQRTDYHFDAQGRLTALRTPDSATQTYEWDGEGQLLSHTDALGAQTRWRYNAAGEVLERTDALGQRLAYAYDAADRLLSLTNENGELTWFAYDVLDRLTDEIGFDGRHQRYAYNAAGELTHLIERGGSVFGPGKVTHFERDVLGRLTAKRHLGAVAEGQAFGPGATSSADAEYRYDKLGRLTHANNAAAQVQFAYDPLGQLIGETQQIAFGAHSAQPQVYAWRRRFDALGNRTQTVLPSLNGAPGRTLEHLFYGSGHLHQINLDGQVVSDFERDALHREIGRSQGALRSQFAYDPAGRLKAQRVTREFAHDRGPDVHQRTGDASTSIWPQTAGPGQAWLGLGPGEREAIGSMADARRVLRGLIERHYDYDASGQLGRILDKHRGVNHYGYDAIGRITSARLAQATPMAANESFGWDAASNPVPVSSSPRAPAALQPPVRGNRLTVWQDAAFRYDEHGNLTERIQGKRGSAAQTLTRLHWDAAHQLVRAEVTRGADAGSATTQGFDYAYDALGRRVAKLDAFGATHFAWDGDRMSIEQRGGNSTITLYEPNSFVPIAQVHNGVLHHLHTDHLGTPLEASNDAGEITWRITYRAWGSVLTEEVTAETGVGRAAAAADPAPAPRLRFQGQYFDSETGLHYNRFRYYDPGPGRFVSQDPIGLQGSTNSGEYARNPINFVDPAGARPRQPQVGAPTHATGRPRSVNGRMPQNHCFAGKTMVGSDLPSDVRGKYPHGVPFNMFGFPDFSRYAAKKVNIGGFTGDSADFSRANELAFGKGNPFGNSPPAGYTWHHTEQNGAMQLVPRDIHDATKHTGGAAICGTRR